MVLKLQLNNDTFYIYNSNNHFRHVYNFSIYKHYAEYKNPNNNYWEPNEKQFARRMFR